MVWRNNNVPNRRRLPSIPTEQKMFSTLARLNVRNMITQIPLIDDDIDKRSGSLEMPECSHQSCASNSRMIFSVHSGQRYELAVEENLKNYDMIQSTIRKPAEKQTDYFQQTLMDNRRSDATSSRQNCSMSFDSSLSPSSTNTNQSSSRGYLIKQQSVTSFRKISQKLDSSKIPVVSGDYQKNRKSSATVPIATSNSSSQSKISREDSNKKVTRRPHSTEVIKSAQTTTNSGSSGKKSVTSLRSSAILPTTKPPSISSNSQSIILFCMENARSDIALRIIQRMVHKREDFAQFYSNLTSEQSNQLVITLKKFLSDIVQNITNSEKIRQISLEYGVEQAIKRNWGFKADFFSLLADALTTECVFLDGAAHQPTETIEAWATLVELMFTNVRDGYYLKTRQLRRNWYDFRSQSNLSSQSDQSFNDDLVHSAPTLNDMFTTV